MAKTLFGAIVVDARNKLGGHVFSKNKAGSFVRRKVSPSQPHTPNQSTIRNGLTALSKAWGGVLTDLQRAAWSAFAQNNPTKDQFGSTVQLTGEQTYVRVNNAILFVGAARIDDPPLSLTVDSITGFAPAAAAGAGTFSIATPTPHPEPATTLYSIYVTRQLSPGVESLQSFYRHLMTFAGTAAAPFDIEAAYVAKFGALEAGKRIGVGIRLIDTLTGAQSPLSTQSVIVAP